VEAVIMSRVTPSIVERAGRLKRALYRDGRPGALMRALNRLDAVTYASGLLAPRTGATLEVVGRHSGHPISLPVAVVELDGSRFLVSMLGRDANWVRNVRAADGRAVLRRRSREQVELDEIPVAERPPVLRRYLAVAPGARPHFPVDWQAPMSEFVPIADRYPVFRINRPQAGPSQRTATERCTS
jgi:deazaflavin-dependent oxidoreductase (nitroreductase family)